MGARGPQKKVVKAGTMEKLPAPPASLKATGKRKWREIGGELIKMKLVDSIDRQALEQLCQAYDQAEAAQKELDEYGYTLQGEKGCYTNPAFNVLANAKRTIKEYISLLGMTRRTRIEIDTKQEETKRTVASRTRR